MRLRDAGVSTAWLSPEGVGKPLLVWVACDEVDLDNFARAIPDAAVLHAGGCGQRRIGDVREGGPERRAALGNVHPPEARMEIVRARLSRGV